MFNGSFLKSVQDITVCEKNRFCLLQSERTKPWHPGLVYRPSAKAQEPVARSRGLVIQPPKLSVGAYFELSFLGCGFLIHLSNRSDSPRFRAPWKKIRQKYGTQQEPSLFKGHPLSCQYVQDITVCEKIRFCLHESGWTKAQCPGLVSRPSAKAQEPLARSRGQWQEQRAYYLAPKTLSSCIF